MNRQYITGNLAYHMLYLQRQCRLRLRLHRRLRLRLHLRLPTGSRYRATGSRLSYRVQYQAAAVWRWIGSLRILCAYVCVYLFLFISWPPLGTLWHPVSFLGPTFGSFRVPSSSPSTTWGCLAPKIHTNMLHWTFNTSQLAKHISVYICIHIQTYVHIYTHIHM